MMMNERQQDADLNIRTEGIQQGFHDSLHHNRYEPTPYALLAELFTAYRLSPGDRLVDFGCGKGRLAFYVHHLFGSEAVGVEMDPGLFAEAMQNLSRYEKRDARAKGRIRFQCEFAENYRVQPQDNRFYFFNPFSVQIFMKVVQNVLKSVEKTPRPVELILFFPSEDYIEFLEYRTGFERVQEIALPGSESDFRERFLVYRLA